MTWQANAAKASEDFSGFGFSADNVEPARKTVPSAGTHVRNLRVRGEENIGIPEMLRGSVDCLANSIVQAFMPVTARTARALDFRAACHLNKSSLCGLSLLNPGPNLFSLLARRDGRC